MVIASLNFKVLFKKRVLLTDSICFVNPTSNYFISSCIVNGLEFNVVKCIINVDI